MTQKAQRPDLSGSALSPGNWSDDDRQGVDYELILNNTYQYCFIEVEQDPLELDFMAFGRMEEKKLSYHPEIHTRAVPEEVSEWLNGRTYAHLEHGADTCRRFVVTGFTESADDESAVFETEGDIGPRDQMTAPDLVQAVAIGKVRAITSDGEGENR